MEHQYLCGCPSSVRLDDLKMIAVVVAVVDYDYDYDYYLPWFVLDCG